jgi:hypothetical protein
MFCSSLLPFASKKKKRTNSPCINQPNKNGTALPFAAYVAVVHHTVRDASPHPAAGDGGGGEIKQNQRRTQFTKPLH